MANIEVILPPSWVNGVLFERAIRKSGDPLNAEGGAVYFRLPKNCKIMVDAGAKLLSLVNQLRNIGKQITVDFEEGELGTLGYLNRMGFIDLLDAEVEILPYRPTISRAKQYKGDNPSPVRGGLGDGRRQHL